MVEIHEESTTRHDGSSQSSGSSPSGDSPSATHSHMRGQSTLAVCTEYSSLLFMILQMIVRSLSNSFLIMVNSNYVKILAQSMMYRKLVG